MKPQIAPFIPYSANYYGLFICIGVMFLISVCHTDVHGSGLYIFRCAD